VVVAVEDVEEDVAVEGEEDVAVEGEEDEEVEREECEEVASMILQKHRRAMVLRHFKGTRSLLIKG
jgi:hypothetical protein